MIKIYKFETIDIPRLIAWIPDARFLLQWAGPQYTFPLDEAQFMKTYEQTKGENPSHFMFKAIHTQKQDVIGHLELMKVDYKKRSAVLGQILIGDSAKRGKGYGYQMVQAILRFAFDDLALKEIDLGVFDFNHSAIKCYQKAGFQPYKIQQNNRQFGDEYWTLIKMKLSEELWQKP